MPRTSKKNSFSTLLPFCLQSNRKKKKKKEEGKKEKEKKGFSYLQAQDSSSNLAPCKSSYDDTWIITMNVQIMLWICNLATHAGIKLFKLPRFHQMLRAHH